MNESANKVYSITWSNDLAAGAVMPANMAQIDNPRQRYKLKSFSWDVRLRYVAAGMANIPFEQNISQEIEISLVALPAGNSMASLMNNLVGVAPAQNGLAIQTYRPQRMEFNSFYMNQTLLVMHTQINRDMVNAIRYYISIVVEIEIIGMI